MKLAPNSTPLSVWDDLHPERQPLQHVVQELDGRLLVELGIDPQDPQAGAVVDGGELVVLAACASLGAGQRLDELDVDLDAVTGQWLLVPLPTAVVALVALGGGQPVQAQPLEDPPHPRVRDRDVVVALEVHGDLGRAEVVVLAQVEDLLHHLDRGGPRADLRPPGPVPQPLDALVPVPAQPDVVQLPADPEVPAGHRDVPGDLLDVPQHRQPAPHLTVQ